MVGGDQKLPFQTAQALTDCGHAFALARSAAMSRSKHQTLKSISANQSKCEVNAMFAEGEHDAMEWVEKGRLKIAEMQRRDADKVAKKAE